MNKPLLCLLLLFPFGLKAQLKQGQLIIDSLLNEISKAPDDTLKVKMLDKVSFAYSKLDPVKGIQYALKAEELSKRLDWLPGLASAWSDLGINYNAKSDHLRAIDYHLKALALYQQLKNQSSVSGVLANISLIYLGRNDYPMALDYAFKALEVDDETGDDHARAIILENIGTIYLEQKKYSKTVEYYSRALETNKKLDDKEGVARNLGNIGIVEVAAGHHSLALTYHLQAFETNKEYGNTHGMQINLANIGIVYSQMDQYDKALEYQFRALKMSEEMGHPHSIAVNLGNIGETYVMAAKSRSGTKHQTMAGKKTTLDLAITYLKRAINLCREIQFPAPQIEFEQYLSEAYHLSGNYQDAFETLKQGTFLKDSLYSKENSNKLAALETQRKMDLKDKDIIIKNTQIEIAALAAANRRIERNVMIGVSGLFIIIMTVVIRRYLKRIRAQRTALEDIATIHAHDIRGPVARILGLTQLFNHEQPADPVNKELIHAVHTVSLQLDEIVKQVVDKTATPVKNKTSGTHEA